MNQEDNGRHVKGNRLKEQHEDIKDFTGLLISTPLSLHHLRYPLIPSTKALKQ